jgi:hypothetical protein
MQLQCLWQLPGCCSMQLVWHSMHAQHVSYKDSCAVEVKLYCKHTDNEHMPRALKLILQASSVLMGAMSAPMLTADCWLLHNAAGCKQHACTPERESSAALHPCDGNTKLARKAHMKAAICPDRSRWACTPQLQTRSTTPPATLTAVCQLRLS